MKVRTQGRAKLTFILKADDLTKLSARIVEFLGPDRQYIIYMLHCSDNTSRTSQDLTEILAYDNANSRQIRSISITGKAADRSLDLFLHANSFVAPVVINADGPDEAATKVVTDIETICEGIAPGMHASRFTLS